MSKKPEKKTQDDCVFIGKKSPFSYAQALQTIKGKRKGTTKVHVLARGRAISRAVDVVEIYTRTWNPAAKVLTVKFGSEAATHIDEATKIEKSITVSTIDIEIEL
jgi:DNA-binding protein